MKLSKKRAKMLRRAINEAIHEIISDETFFDQDVIKYPPDLSGVTGWKLEDIRRFDMLRELEAKIDKKIFGVVFEVRGD